MPNHKSYDLAPNHKSYDLALELERQVNSTSLAEVSKNFCEGLNHSHRTLQQKQMGVFIEAMKMWADNYNNGLYDLRNEATCRLCEAIVNQFEDAMHLPFI